MEQHGNSVLLPLPLPEPLPATPLPLPDWLVALPGQSLPLSGYSMILLNVKWYKANLNALESIINNSTLKTMLELWNNLTITVCSEILKMASFKRGHSFAHSFTA